MTVRFTTSIGGETFSYLEGQTLDLPSPTPGRFLDWLKRGIVVPVRGSGEVALAPGAVERAVSRRRKPAARATTRETAAVADGAP